MNVPLIASRIRTARGRYEPRRKVIGGVFLTDLTVLIGVLYLHIYDPRRV